VWQLDTGSLRGSLQVVVQSKEQASVGRNHRPVVLNRDANQQASSVLKSSDAAQAMFNPFKNDKEMEISVCGAQLFRLFPFTPDQSIALKESGTFQ
jgi:hypothetical protein